MKIPSQPTLLPKAGLVKRFAAFFYDFLLLMAIYFLLGAVAVAINQGEAIKHYWSLTISLGIFPLVAFFFYAWFWQRSGQTLGMQAWRLQLIADTGSITFTHCLYRYCVSVSSLACAGLGFFGCCSICIIVVGRILLRVLMFINYLRGALVVVANE